MLTDHDAEALIEIARDAIIQCVADKPFEPRPREEKALNKRSGCFVTIMRNGQLRGCIGHFQGTKPLFREVADIAKASATQDPRFPPLSNAELDSFSLEITVLSPLEKIEDTSNIEIGKHGIYIEKGLNRGVLLPQVAVEHNWDRVTFLQQTCRKAGLEADAWQHPDAEIYIFSGQIVTEKQ